MSGIRSAAAPCVLAVLALAWPVQAVASGGWDWPVDGPVTLAYGAGYTSDSGVSCTHGGIDVGAGAGTSVRACTSGEVVFSGQVPAGEGRRAYAVTVLTGDGLRVTYLPLERALVERGASVSGGDAVGVLAAAGDASGASPHLHLGVRRGETRLDPLSLLGEGDVDPAPVPPVEAVQPKTPAPRSPRAVPHPGHTSPSGVRGPQGAGRRAPIAATAPRTLAPIPRLSPLRLPALRLLRRVDDGPRVRVAKVAADVASARERLGAILACLGLAGLAGACVWPALRDAIERGGSPVRSAVAMRHDDA